MKLYGQPGFDVARYVDKRRLSNMHLEDVMAP